MEKPKIRFKGYQEDWEQRKLGDVADVRDGTHDSPKYQSIGHPFVTSKNVKNGYITYDDIQYISDEDFAEINKRSKVDVNDILMGMIGTIGNMALIRTEPDFAIKNVALIKDTKQINYLYLYHFLQSPFIEKQLTSGMDGGTQKFVSLGNVRNLNVIYPSDIEQDKIGCYFEKLDHLITLHQRKCEETKILKKYMLQKMFPQNGHSVPEIRFSGFTEDWEQRKLGEISQITAGGTPSTKELTYWNPKEVPWLASGEVHKKYIYDTDEMISEEGLNNSSAKWVEEGSVLIALAGQGKTRGTAAITRIPITTNQSIAAIKFNDILDADYAFHNLDSRYDELRNISSGDGTRGGLNKQLLADLTITFPQICEQRAIGEYFTNLDHLITLHQQKCGELRNIKKFMLQNMFI